MSPRLGERIAYGRSVRDQALILLAAHGAQAEARARDAADDHRLPEADRHYWTSVASRIARLRAPRPMLPRP